MKPQNYSHSFPNRKMTCSPAEAQSCWDLLSLPALPAHRVQLDSNKFQITPCLGQGRRLRFTASHCTHNEPRLPSQRPITGLWAELFPQALSKKSRGKHTKEAPVLAPESVPAQQHYKGRGFDSSNCSWKSQEQHRANQATALWYQTPQCPALVREGRVSAPA